MYRAGRPVDPDFADDELLYNRCRAVHVAEQRLLPEGIKFPDWSVNRSKYSEPDDVLLPSYSDWGIVEFKVDSVPKKLISPGEVVFEFKVEHDPVEDNYSHSEVRTYKGGVHNKKIDPNTAVKKQFRQMLSDKTRLIRFPQA